MPQRKAEINDQEIETFKEAFDEAKLWDSDYLKFMFSHSPQEQRELSSGEMSFLTMLARLFFLTDKRQRFANRCPERRHIETRRFGCPGTRRNQRAKPSEDRD